MSIVVCGGQGGGQPVTQPSSNLLGVEEVTVQLDGGGGLGGPLAGSLPVY